MPLRAITRRLLPILALAPLFTATPLAAQPAPERQLIEAAEVIREFTADDANAIPAELLQRARGIAVVPDLFRGGFILGARRGRGVLAVRTADGSWSNPAFVTVTGGSIGWQIGAESTDLVLIFANDNAVKNIETGKFTLGGDATAVAGPLGRHATANVTFRAEVYGYLSSRGLYAGAAFQGARLDIDEELAQRFYGQGSRAVPLAAQSFETPTSARAFLDTLAQVAPVTRQPGLPAASNSGDTAAGDESVTFPLED
jgi:lipid-binding SYLF domain-containing protein